MAQEETFEAVVFRLRHEERKAWNAIAAQCYKIFGRRPKVQSLPPIYKKECAKRQVTPLKFKAKTVSERSRPGDKRRYGK